MDARGEAAPRPNPTSGGDSATPRGASLPLRWSLLVAFFVAELIGITIRFDTEALTDGSGAGAALLGHAPAALSIALAFAAAFLVVAGPRLPAIAREMRHAAEGHVWWPWLAAQLLAFAAFAWCSARVFDGAETTSEVAASWLGAWIGLALTSLSLWLLALAPAAAWRRLAGRERAALLLAALAGAAAWALGQAAQTFWQPLASATFWLSNGLLNLVYTDVVYEMTGRILGTPTFRVQIAPQCSGYEGIALVGVFLTLYLWLFRRSLRFPQAFLLFPIGALAIWLLNAVRITALIAIGSSVSRDVALGGFHSQAGWIAFIAVALGLIALTHRVRLFAAAGGAGVAREETARNDLAAALLVPFAVLMAAIILTSAFSSGFDGLYPLRVAATAAAIWCFREVYRRWDWRCSWQSPAIGAAVFGLWILLAPAPDGRGAELQNEVAALPPAWAALWLAFRVIGSVVTVPLAEELAFRGYLIRKLVSRDWEGVAPGRFTWLSFVLSSLLFGLLHGQWIAGAIAGAGYALALYHRGRLTDAVAAHMTSNALIAFSVLVFGQWSLWA